MGMDVWERNICMATRPVKSKSDGKSRSRSNGKSKSRSNGKSRSRSRSNGKVNNPTSAR